VETGERKLLKFAFFESFYTSLAGVKIRCFRNPEKESRILELVEALVESFEAIRKLHINGFRHGDIRDDHLIVEQESGKYVWIDFDYDYDAPENPFSLDLIGMGNILLYARAKDLSNST
jgi:predicted Ser/Thr protein kinase